MKKGAWRSRLAKARAFMQKARGMSREKGTPYTRQARWVMEGHADEDWNRMMAECETVWRAKEDMINAFDLPELGQLEEEEVCNPESGVTRSSAAGQDADPEVRSHTRLPSDRRGAYGEDAFEREVDAEGADEGHLPVPQEDFDQLRYGGNGREDQIDECMQCGLDQEWLD